MRGRETVTIHRPGAAGRFGEPGTPAPDRQVRGCIIIPRTSSERTDREDTVVVGLTLVLPPGTDLRATDTVTARGRHYAVAGEPGDYRTAGGRAVNVIAALERSA